jgi:hypothetical protein
MEVEHLSQTSVHMYQTTRNHIPEIRNLHNKHYSKLKSPLNLIHFSSLYCSAVLSWITVFLFSFRRTETPAFVCCMYAACRLQWPRGLRLRSAAAHLLRMWVQIPPEAWMSVRFECFALLSRDLCDELIVRAEDYYRLWWAVVCDLETSWMKRPWSALGRSATKKIK